ncbi:hypothetical protein P7C73_g1903, partial [Tremellales sp. Uapishka_1]
MSAQHSMQNTKRSQITIRPATVDDAAACGRITHDAFSTISADHGYPSDFPSAEEAFEFLSAMFSTSGYHGLVAEHHAEGQEGAQTAGSCVVGEQDVVQSIGPISVDTHLQKSGTGRRLLEAAISRMRSNGAIGMRLVGAAFNNGSFSLYTSLGFDVREPLSCLQGRTHTRHVEGCVVRPATAADMADCNTLSRKIHGFARESMLSQAVSDGTARVVSREGKVTGYATSLGYFGHATAETNLDIQALLADVDSGSFESAGILVPTRNSDLLRWCLANGLRVVQPMTLMTMGFYREPAGAWLPSVLY